MDVSTFHRVLASELPEGETGIICLRCDNPIAIGDMCAEAFEGLTPGGDEIVVIICLGCYFSEA